MDLLMDLGNRWVNGVVELIAQNYWTSVASIALAILIYKEISLYKLYAKLQKKVVVITGASSGIGETLAHEFYKRGCQVVLCARRQHELERVKADLLKSNPPRVHTYTPIVMPLDLSDVDNLSKNVEDILQKAGRIDILVNNGGISHRGAVIDTTSDVDTKIMLVNYFGAVALTKAVLPSMISRRCGHIVQISSIQGLIGLPHRSAYCATKHALQAFSDSLRAEVAASNIYVTVASPGYVKTKLSINALTASGDVHGQMDKTTEEGYDPSYVAQQIIEALVQKKKETIIATPMVKVAVYLRKFIPSLYFYVMARRAKKTHN